MFYLNKCLKKIITHWSKTAWVTKIYQTFQPTAEELKPSEKWNTLLPRRQTGAILIYHKAWFTLKIIDTNSIHSALLCQCSSTRAEREAQTQPLSAMPEQGAANPNTNQGWMIIALIRTGHQLFSQSFAKLKRAANQNYFESWKSGKTFTPWGQESNEAVCPKPALSPCLDIFETRLNSIPSTTVWPHSRSCLEQATGQDHLPRSLPNWIILWITAESSPHIHTQELVWLSSAESPGSSILEIFLFSNILPHSKRDGNKGFGFFFKHTQITVQQQSSYSIVF